MNIASFAIISLRLLAVAVFFLATWKMLGGIISSLGDINPAYFGYFFQKVIFKEGGIIGKMGKLGQSRQAGPGQQHLLFEGAVVVVTAEQTLQGQHVGEQHEHPDDPGRKGRERSF